MNESLRDLTRKPATALVAVVVIHLILAFSSGLPMVYKGGDNAGYLIMAQTLAEEGVYQERWDYESETSEVPRAYPMVLALLILAGAKTLGVFKALSVVFTGLAVAFVFLWVHKIRDLPTAFLVSLLFGASPAVLEASRWMLPEPMLLALFAASAWVLAVRSGPARTDVDLSPATPEKESSQTPTRAVWLGLALATLALLTDRAGTIWLAAIMVWLGFQRRWVILTASVVPVTVILIWSEYLNTVWAYGLSRVNTLVPELGTADLGDFLSRIADNATRLSLDVIPNGLGFFGIEVMVLKVVGFILVAFAVVGWLRNAKFRPDPAWLYALLLTSTLFVWPSISSDFRHALPLLPLVLLYVSDAIRWLATAKLSQPLRAARYAFAVVVASLLVPAGVSWSRTVAVAQECRRVTDTQGPWACWGSDYFTYHNALVWISEHLPPDRRVLARKPRLFYMYTARQSRIFFYPPNRSEFIEQAKDHDFRHYLHINWDSLSQEYMLPFILANHDLFCVHVRFRSQPDINVVTLFDIVDPYSVPYEANVSPLPTLYDLPLCREEGETLPPVSEEVRAATIIPILNR